MATPAGLASIAYLDIAWRTADAIIITTTVGAEYYHAYQQPTALSAVGTIDAIAFVAAE